MPPDVQIAPANQAQNDSAVPEIPKLNRNDAVGHCFVAQGWHLPYAEALIEEVIPFLPIAIQLAERAILNRYLELHGSTEASEERDDLWRAAEELQELKRKAAQNAFQLEHYSA